MPAWLSGGLGLVLAATATLERFPIDIGDWSIYPGHIVAILLFPVLLIGRREVRSLLGVLTVTYAVVLIVSVPSLLALPSTGPRLSTLLQFALNAYSLALAFALFNQMSREALRRWCGIAACLLLASALLQAVIAPGLNARGTHTFGIPRPTLFFTEEGWLGLYAALLFIACLALGSWVRLAASGFVVLLQDNRAAYLVCLVVLGMAIPWVRRHRGARILLYLLPAVLTVLFVASTIWDFEVPLLTDDGTLETRAVRIQAILIANDGNLLPWGGPVLDLIDPRGGGDGLLKTTINVWTIDMMWKFGLAGLVSLVAWSWMFIRGIPAKLTANPASRTARIIVGGMFALVCAFQFDNGSGRPWAWILVGLCYAAIAKPEPRLGESRPKRARRSGRSGAMSVDPAHRARRI